MSIDQLPTQIANAGFIYANGCKVFTSPPTIVSISAGQVRDYTNTYDIVVPQSLSISTAFAGPGGLDTGTILANTFYAVYVLYDVSQTNPPVGLLSRVSSQPLMPSLNGITYTSYRLLGYVKTDNSSELYNISMIGNGTLREQFMHPTTAVVVNGTAIAYADVDLSPAVPAILGTSDAGNPVISFSASVQYNPGTTAGSLLEIKNGGSTDAADCIVSGPVASVVFTGSINCSADYFTSGKYLIKYQNSNAGGATSIYIHSFKYVI
jgi:hypothetical protein